MFQKLMVREFIQYLKPSFNFLKFDTFLIWLCPSVLKWVIFCVDSMQSSCQLEIIQIRSSSSGLVWSGHLTRTRVRYGRPCQPPLTSSPLQVQVRTGGGGSGVTCWTLLMILSTCHSIVLRTQNNQHQINVISSVSMGHCMFVCLLNQRKKVEMSSKKPHLVPALSYLLANHSLRIVVFVL